MSSDDLFPTMNKELLEIGQISKTHGVRGDVVVKLDNQNSRAVKAKSIIYIEGSESVPVLVEQIRYGNKTILKLENYNNCDEAERLVRRKIYFPKSLIQADLKSDEYLLNDVIGFEVITREGVKLGVITSFSDNGCQDIASVKRTTGKHIDILLIKEFIQELSIKKRVLVYMGPLEIF